VHPNVFTACGIDPEEYSGWAFGFGIERIAMRKYGIGNIRLFVENDIRRAREGAGFLAIYSPLEIESQRICELLKPFGPIAMQRYLASGIESLI